MHIWAPCRLERLIWVPLRHNRWPRQAASEISNSRKVSTEKLANVNLWKLQGKTRLFSSVFKRRNPIIMSPSGPKKTKVEERSSLTSVSSPWCSLWNRVFLLPERRLRPIWMDPLISSLRKTEPLRVDNRFTRSVGTLATAATNKDSDQTARRLHSSRSSRRRQFMRVNMNWAMASLLSKFYSQSMSRWQSAQCLNLRFL